MSNASNSSERNTMLLKVYADLVQLHPNHERYMKQYAQLLLHMGNDVLGIKVLRHLHDLLRHHNQYNKANALAQQYPMMDRAAEEAHWQKDIQSLLPAFSRNRLWLRLHQQRLREGQHLFYRGDQLDTLYLVCEGELAEFAHTTDGTPILLALIQAGDVVAENKLLNIGSHKVDVIANKTSIIVKLPRKKMLAALSTSPMLKKILAHKVENRRLIRFISSNSLLQILPFDMRQQLAEESYIQTYSKGTIIYKAGDKLDHIALIIEGEAHYQLHNHDAVTQLKSLPQGALIGEEAAMHDSGCPADLLTTEGVTLVCIAQTAFMHAVKSYAPLHKQLRASTEQQRVQIMHKLNELETQQL